MMAASPLRLVGSGLACVRGGREVFARVNFSLTAGQAMAVTGPNGSGKTTLLRVVAGLLRLAGGSLELQGAGADALLPEQAHYLGHQDALKPSLTVAENLRFWTAYLGDEKEAAEASAAGLEMAGLAELAEIPAAYLSAGQRRRLSLARLVAAPRPVWLLDEPATALDAQAQQILGDLMQAHLASGGLVMAATHGPLPLAHVQELRMGEAA